MFSATLALQEHLFSRSPSQTLTLHKEINIQGVHYAYPASPDKPVLQNFSLVIPAKTSVGITGKSGAGKSTLMDILLGLLEPQLGVLKVDGNPITPANAAAWQRSIGYVPQHIYLADASVAENIAFGVEKHQIDLQAVERAARIAQIHDFVIHEMPNGYNTLVGEKGTRLSGGQRQRLGIARALYHEPDVICMDEATSALDGQTEEGLNEAIKRSLKNKTIIVISHKQASLQHCDQVIEINPLENRHD